MKFYIASLLASFSCLQGSIPDKAFQQLVYDIRNPQTNAKHFRESLETIGEYLALNVLEELERHTQTQQTLTGSIATHELITETPVLVTILRAGLPLNNGVQKVFPLAEVGFIAMSRDEKTLQAKSDYIALPYMENKVVIITDTMLATGGSLLMAIEKIEKLHPKKIYIISAIASAPGIERLKKHNPNIVVFASAIDPSLNEKGYIIPGLGDAGDRSYGKKELDH